MPSKTVAFIHGAFVTKHCWDPWIERYQARGYNCVPIAWPGRDKTVETLKLNPDDPFLSTLSISDAIDHHVNTIEALAEKPIIIGHSTGGLFTQIMLQRDLGVAGVAIDSVPPQGVLTMAWSFIRSLWPVLNPLIPSSRPYYMTFPQFQYSFAHTLPLVEQHAAYASVIVPESRRLARGALSSAARVDFKRERAPLLMIAGEKDHIMPASLNRSNYLRYGESPSVTGFKEFPGRTHYTAIAGSGWEEVADYALDWANRAQAADTERRAA